MSALDDHADRLAADERHEVFALTAASSVAAIAMNLRARLLALVHALGYEGAGNFAAIHAATTDAMRARAERMLADAFCRDAIRGIVAEFAFGDDLTGDRVDIFEAICMGLETMWSTD